MSHIEHRQIVPLPIRAASRLLIRLLGWKVVGDFSALNKCVIVTQHTSNWDGVYSIFGSFSIGVRPRWLGKKQLFSGFVGKVMRLAGGIAIDRSEQADMVGQLASRFAEEDELWLFVAPEGTRHKADYWKSGFYYIALQAQVPIVHGYLDYATRQVGVGDHLYPSGDITADMAIIREWFSHTTPRHPEQAAPIKLKPTD